MSKGQAVIQWLRDSDTALFFQVHADDVTQKDNESFTIKSSNLDNTTPAK